MATFTQTDPGSGEIRRYDDPYAEVDQATAAQAAQLETHIIETKDAIEGNFLRLAFLLDVFDEHKLYLGVGFPDMKTWAGSDHIELGWRVVIDLLRIKREVYPILPGDEDEKMAKLAAVKVSKLRSMLPLLSDDRKDDFLDLLERAPYMTWNDVRREVKALRTGEDESDPDPVVFTAKTAVGEKTTVYTVSANDGITWVNVGKLEIPNEWTSRWNERFGKFVKEEGRDY